MTRRATTRAMEAAGRRQQREAQKRQRELERLAKEQAKLSIIEQARLEVETHANQLKVLLSIHWECGDPWDWTGFAVALPPPAPVRTRSHEFKARRLLLATPSGQRDGAEAAINQAQSQDEQAFEEAIQDHARLMADHEQMQNLARRILAHEHGAYIDALVDLSPLGELSNLGSSLHFTVHSAKLIECAIKVNGMQAIPTEVKTLTTTGRISVKAMPKSRYHEVYQDYVCGCMLRVAREVFAMLPVESLLVTASADFFEPGTGQLKEQPVLSAIMPRSVVTRLPLEYLDPSDALEKFQHRGDFKASRKTGIFQPITPLRPTDALDGPVEALGVDFLLARVQQMHRDLKSRAARLFKPADAGNS